MPYSLTASDGSGLAVTRVEARAVFEGPLAYTELHLWFHNPENRRREGTFQITLPGHAAVSRFAMENDGQWMEAEVVEKQLARRAYDDFLHRRQDPALLEKADGNQFTAKVFPIAPNADKHIVISFSQTLPGAQYVLPLRGLPRVGQVDVELKTRGPDGRLVRRCSPAQLGAGSRLRVGGATTAAAVERGDARRRAGDGRRCHRGEGDARGRHAARRYECVARARLRGVRRVDPQARRRHARRIRRHPVQVSRSIRTPRRSIAAARAASARRRRRSCIERGAAGASDLGQALAFVGKGGEKRVVVVTDGVVTAGAEGAELAARVKAMGAERLDVVLAGGIRDEALATQLVRATPHAGTVLDADTDDVVAALARPVATDLAVAVGNAAWVYPHVIPSARVGERVMVYARLKAPAQAVDVTVGKTHDLLAMLAGTQPLVERAVASAEIDELEARLSTAKADDAAAIKAAIVKRSLASRAISSQTSLLVLESDADYARYGIDRKALADILVVGPSGIERQHQMMPPAQLAQPAMNPTSRRSKRRGQGHGTKELALAGADDGKTAQHGDDRRRSRGGMARRRPHAVGAASAATAGSPGPDPRCRADARGATAARRRRRRRPRSRTTTAAPRPRASRPRAPSWRGAAGRARGRGEDDAPRARAPPRRGRRPGARAG